MLRKVTQLVKILTCQKTLNATNPKGEGKKKGRDLVGKMEGRSDGKTGFGRKSEVRQPAGPLKMEGEMRKKRRKEA